MRPAAAAGALVFLSAAAGAEVPSGYAFGRPELLAEQLVWGRAHGVRLLAAACRAHGDAQAESAYLAWLETQSSQIAAAGAVLARHYFGRDRAPLEAIDAALGLKPRIEAESDTLAEACATLPEALASPRHDLTRYRRDILEKLGR